MAVMHIGAPACGMNAAVRSFVRNCIYRGDVVFGIHDGIEGLIAGNIKQMNWYKRVSNKFIFSNCIYASTNFRHQFSIQV